MTKRSRSVSLALMSLAPVLLAACAQEAPVADEPLRPLPKPAGPTAYETVEACVFDGNSQDVCDTGFKTAQAQAAQNAPRFATGAECELEFENCQPAPEATAVAAAPAAAAAAGASTQPAQAGGGSSFIPIMAGFMLGQAMGNSGAGMASAGFDGRRDNGRDTNRPVTSGGSAGASSVLYRARNGQLSQVSSLSGGRPVAQPVQARTVTSANVADAKAAQARATQARAQARAANRSVSRSGFGGRSGGSGG